MTPEILTTANDLMRKMQRLSHELTRLKTNGSDDCIALDMLSKQGRAEILKFAIEDMQAEFNRLEKQLAAL